MPEEMIYFSFRYSRACFIYSRHLRYLRILISSAPNAASIYQGATFAKVPLASYRRASKAGSRFRLLLHG